MGSTNCPTVCMFKRITVTESSVGAHCLCYDRPILIFRLTYELEETSVVEFMTRFIYRLLQVPSSLYRATYPAMNIKKSQSNLFNSKTMFTVRCAECNKDFHTPRIAA